MFKVINLQIIHNNKFFLKTNISFISFLLKCVRIFFSLLKIQYQETNTNQGNLFKSNLNWTYQSINKGFLGFKVKGSFNVKIEIFLGNNLFIDETIIIKY